MMVQASLRPRCVCSLSGVCMHGIRMACACRCRSRCKSRPLHLLPSNQCPPRQSLRQRGSTPTRVGLSSDLTRMRSTRPTAVGVIGEWGRPGRSRSGSPRVQWRRGYIVPNRTCMPLICVRDMLYGLEYRETSIFKSELFVYGFMKISIQYIIRFHIKGPPVGWFGETLAL